MMPHRGFSLSEPTPYARTAARIAWAALAESAVVIKPNASPVVGAVPPYFAGCPRGEWHYCAELQCGAVHHVGAVFTDLIPEAATEEAAGLPPVSPTAEARDRSA